MHNAKWHFCFAFANCWQTVNDLSFRFKCTGIQTLSWMTRKWCYKHGIFSSSSFIFLHLLWHLVFQKTVTMSSELWVIVSVKRHLGKAWTHCKTCSLAEALFFFSWIHLVSILTVQKKIHRIPQNSIETLPESVAGATKKFSTKTKQINNPILVSTHQRVFTSYSGAC